MGLISIDIAKDWIPKLWNRLKSIRKKYQDELEELNTITFGDPLEIAKYYVEPNCQKGNPADRHEEDFLVAAEPVMKKEPVMKEIDQFFDRKIFNQGDNQMIVLSDAGMGKTALLTMLKLMHLTSFLPKGNDCVLKRLGESTLEEIAAIENKMKTILLLDSLDEDPLAYGRSRERIVEILRATQHFFRVIITCRTQFFPEGDEKVLEDKGMISIDEFDCPVKYLSFFNDKMVQTYLSKRFRRFFGLLADKKKIEASLEIIEKMGSLRCRPMLLAYIDKLTDSEVQEEGSECRSYDEYTIYDVLVKSWLRREKSKGDISVKDLLHACIILAAYMQVKRVRDISEQELERLISAIAWVKPVKHIELKGRSLLNRNSEGHYRFSHYSIQEFLVAKLLLEEPVWKPSQSIPVTDFIFRMIAMSKKAPNFPELLDCKGLNLSETELENVRLPGADFSGVNFSKANLSGCDFCNANFSGANLEGCIFKDCELKETEFTGAHFTGSCRINTKLGMNFVYIPPGEFMMGSPENEPGRYDNETQHRVILTKRFFMQTTPVTQGQWKAVMGNNPSHFKNGGDDCPVECVSWEDAKTFIERLNQAEDTDAYRLPTEAEWEYACRAGSTSRYCFGDDERQLSEYAWYDSNSGGKTNPVGQKKPNAWGLYDMHGNIWEWCEDWYGEYPSGDVTDPTGPDTGSSRVRRGGSWNHSAVRCRSAYRGRYTPGNRNHYIGFRLALSPGQQHPGQGRYARRKEASAPSGMKRRSDASFLRAGRKKSRRVKAKPLSRRKFYDALRYKIATQISFNKD